MRNCLRKKLLLVTLLPLLALASARAQTGTLTGRVTDAGNRQPLPFAHVFINNTTIGTTTDEGGRYRLTNVPLGTVELVASYVGYQPFRQSIRLEDGRERTVDLAPKALNVTLADVTVKARRDKSWQRRYRQFERDILGNSPFSGQCSIKNPQVVELTEEDGHLKATVSEPLVIQNEALGYRILYDMQYFDSHRGTMYYAGTTRFEELRPADASQAARWQKNRRQAYQGSTRHLMTSLIAGTAEQEGFLVYRVNPSVAPSGSASLSADINRHLQPLTDSRSLFLPGRLPFERQLVSMVPLKVFFTKIQRPSPYRDYAYAFSEFRFPQGSAELTDDGRITMPKGMLTLGYLGNDRLSTLLPADWKPNAPTDTGPTLPPEGRVLAGDYRLDSLARAWNDRHRYQAPALFLHLDKTLYATGDRLWLSAYLLEPSLQQLMPVEEALHVDLLTPGGRLVQHQWLPIVDGRAAGDFRLSDSLETGTYRLRAYTDKDQTAVRPAFERPVAVYNITRSGSRPPAEADSLDIQFLPEGGRWVAGVPVRMGFRAVGPDGRGRPVKGRILDREGTLLALFSANQFGIGSVEVRPKAGQDYRAEVSFKENVHYVDLPPVEQEGLVLTADVVGDTNVIRLRVLGSATVQNEPVYLIFQSRGRLVHQVKAQLQQGRVRVDVPAPILPEGVCQVTLYDAQGAAQAERLVFVPERTTPIRVLVTPDKSAYRPRDRVVLDLALTDGTAPPLAYLSASVTDAGQVPEDTAAADFRAHLLLTGDLRGQVEQPGFYLADRRPETRRALDDLLLTQGWRRVGLKPAEIPSDSLRGIAFSGRILDEKARPVPHAQLLLTSRHPTQPFTLSVGADSRGHFRLAGLSLTDTVPLLMQVMDARWKPMKGRVEPDRPGGTWATVRTDPGRWVNAETVRQQLEAARIRQETDPDLYRDKTARLLKEVKVKAFRPAERPDDVARRSLHDRADATIVFDEKSPPFNNLYEMLIGRVSGVQVARNTNGGYDVNIRSTYSFVLNTNPLYLIDGVPMDDPNGTALMSINPMDIERIEVLKNGRTTAIYGVRGGNGVIAYYTKQWRRDKSAGSGPGIEELSLIGFPVRREFYVPKYEGQPEETARIDRRDVLYWKPLMQTDSKGRSAIAFPLSDVVRTIRVVVQGITTDGRPVAAVSLVKVQ